MTKIRDCIRCTLIAWLAIAGLLAAEYHGSVKFGGLPVPGAMVTATQGEKRVVAISNDAGAYSFADLADGVWKMKVEMLCFEPIEQEVTVGTGAAGSDWELKLLSLEAIQAVAPPPLPKSAPATATTMAIAAPPPEKPTIQTAAPAGKGKKGKAAPPSPAGAQSGFQRADLNASADAGKLASETPADSSQAADGFLVNGSVNNGAASPFAQSAAFGNNRRGARSLYNEAIGFTMDNSALDARSFSLTGQDTPKPAYNHLKAVASFGGPLRIPHLIRGNTLNFFVGYQLIRNRNATTQPVPGADARGARRAISRRPSGAPIHRSRQRLALSRQRDSAKPHQPAGRRLAAASIRCRTSIRRRDTTTRFPSDRSPIRMACKRG